jgi:hypothetical protein
MPIVSCGFNKVNSHFLNSALELGKQQNMAGCGPDAGLMRGWLGARLLGIGF